MKKFILSIAVIGMALFFGGTAKAGNIVPVEVSTLAVTVASNTVAQIAGTKTIDKLTVTNSSATPTMLTVYRNCGSTTTITAVLKVLVPGSAAGGTVILNFTDQVVNNPFRYTDVCFRKADAVDYIYASAFYR